MTHVEGHTPPTRRARKMFPRPRFSVDMVPPDAMLVGEVTEMSKRKPHAEDGYEQRLPLLEGHQSDSSRDGVEAEVAPQPDTTSSRGLGPPHVPEMHPGSAEDAGSSPAGRLDSFTARARADDPDTSHDAAERANKIGLAAKHASIIVVCLGMRPATSKELGKITELGQHAVARRMSELRAAGLVKVIGKRDRQQVYALAQGGER